MYVKLLVRNGDATAVKDLFGGFEKIKVNRPVIRILRPSTEIDDERVFRLLSDTDENGMFGIVMNDEFMHISQIMERFFCQLDIGIQCDSDFQIHTAKLVCTVIHNGGIGKRSIGNGNDFVIEGRDHGIENADIGNLSEIRACFNAITDVEGLKNNLGILK